MSYKRKITTVIQKHCTPLIKKCKHYILLTSVMKVKALDDDWSDLINSNTRANATPASSLPVKDALLLTANTIPSLMRDKTLPNNRTMMNTVT